MELILIFGCNLITIGSPKLIIKNPVFIDAGGTSTKNVVVGLWNK